MLAEKAQAQYPGAPLPIALLADCKPSELETVAIEALRPSLVAQVAADRANRSYNEFRTRLEGRGVQVQAAITLLAQDALDAEEEHNALLNEETSLANEIIVTQLQLARPMRKVAVVLSAFALGCASAGSMYTAETDTPSTASKIEVSDRSVVETPAVIAGVSGAAVGGLGGLLIGFKLVGHEARRRARKIALQEAEE